MLDENPAPGGQIYRAITTTPVEDRAHARRRLLARGRRWSRPRERSGAEIAGGALVWSLDREREIGVSRGGGARMIKARRVILATGALERPFPIPGWTLPGVMTAGAAQTLLKSSGLVPEGRMVIAGMGPLLWLLAAQLLRAGAQHRCHPRYDAARGLSARAARMRRAFLLSPLLAKGLALMREVRATRAASSRRHAASRPRATARCEPSASRGAAGRRSGSASTSCCCIRAWCRTSTWPWPPASTHRWDPLQLCWSPVLDS